MLVAITGGTGFLGSQLAALHLGRGDRVRILKRPGIQLKPELPGAEMAEGDITSNDDRLPRFADGVDILYHCAAELRDERAMEATNARGTRNLAQAAAGRIGRWVQVSSVAVYGAPAIGSITEDHPALPHSLYGSTKAEAERIVLAAAAKGGFAATVVRPSNIFGTGMPGTALFSLFRMIERGWFFHIGKPGAIMNCVHVADVAEALLLCGTHPAAAGRIFNISDDLPIERFAAIVADELGVPRPALRLPESPLQAMAILFGWIPGMPLTRGRLNALTVRARYSSDRLRRELAYDRNPSVEERLRNLARDWKAR